jgi:PAS domain S-box-containing protein
MDRTVTDSEFGTAAPAVPLVPPQPIPYDAPGVEAAFDSVVDAVLVIDDGGAIVFANRASERMFGYRRHELVGQSVEGLVPAPLRSGHRDHRRHYAVNPTARPMGVGLPLSAARKDGSVFPAEISLAPMTTQTGVFTTAVVRDVSEVRAREEEHAARLRSEAHLALSQRVALMGSWEEDLQGGRMTWSEELYELLGQQPGSVEPSLDTLYRLVHPDDLALLRVQMVRARREGGRCAAEVRLADVDSDRPPRTVAVRASVELDEDGRAVRCVGTVQDVTARTALERELSASDRRFRIAFDQAPTGLALVNVRPGHPQLLMMANAALAEMTGIPQAELLACTVEDIIERPDAESESGCDRMRAGLTDTANLPQVRLRRPDGATRWAQITTTLVRDAEGRPDYLVAHVVDITGRKRDEEQARERAARDSRIAAVLQAGLMPYVPRSVGPVRAASRYRPAGHGETVGGDWTDVLSLPDGKIGMVVGDVAGHGIESAATMTRLRTVVRMLATSGVSPAGVMRRLNDVMHETDMGSDIDLATLVYAQLDPGTGTFRHCSAGHLPLLMLGGDRSGRYRAVAPVPAVGGPPIGVIPGLRYTEQEIRLEPGSTLIGFTDGLVERRGHDLDESLLRLLAGLGGLPTEATLDVETLADAVLDLSPGLSDRAGDGGEDDIAVIVLGFDVPAGLTRTVAADLDTGAVAALTASRAQLVDLHEVAARPPERWA